MPRPTRDKAAACAVYALRLGLVAGAAFVAYLALSAMDRPAYADSGQVLPHAGSLVDPVRNTLDLPPLRTPEDSPVPADVAVPAVRPPASVPAVRPPALHTRPAPVPDPVRPVLDRVKTTPDAPAVVVAPDAIPPAGDIAADLTRHATGTADIVLAPVTDAANTVLTPVTGTANTVLTPVTDVAPALVGLVSRGADTVVGGAPVHPIAPVPSGPLTGVTHLPAPGAALPAHRAPPVCTFDVPESSPTADGAAPAPAPAIVPLPPTAPVSAPGERYPTCRAGAAIHEIVSEPATGTAPPTRRPSDPSPERNPTPPDTTLTHLRDPGAHHSPTCATPTSAWLLELDRRLSGPVGGPAPGCRSILPDHLPG